MSNTLLKKLAQKALSIAEARNLTDDEQLIQQLIERRMLDDARLAREIAERFTGRLARGDQAIRAALEQRGIPADLIAETVADLGSEQDRIHMALEDRGDQPLPKNARFLASRGFSAEAIENFVAQAECDGNS